MAKGFSTIDVAAEAGVLTITLNRPDVLNAVNEAMCVELGAALRTAQRDEAIRCLVLTGAGRAFCAGQDLRELQQEHERAAGGRELDLGWVLRQRYNPLIGRLRTLEKPALAAVNGPAAGAGAGLAFACDLRICARSAYFKMAFVDLGLIADAGSTLTLLQHVGYGRAAELCFLGEKLSADEAGRCGLANRVVDDAALPAVTRQIAARLASLPTRAIGLTKRALNRAWTALLEDQLEYEAFLQQTAGKTADHRAGLAAFLEKRAPQFEGR